ncbi:MAG: hypothetical protein LCH81_01820 [Bacteroidetes bacterium]|nr:hypothetical protein [Bacteroidota bacterium]
MMVVTPGGMVKVPDEVNVRGFCAETACTRHNMEKMNRFHVLLADPDVVSGDTE